LSTIIYLNPTNKLEFNILLDSRSLDKAKPTMLHYFRVDSAITFFGLLSNVEWWRSLNKIYIIIIIIMGRIGAINHASSKWSYHTILNSCNLWQLLSQSMESIKRKHYGIEQRNRTCDFLQQIYRWRIRTRPIWKEFIKRQDFKWHTQNIEGI